jgi:hypothetical protein
MGIVLPILAGMVGIIALFADRTKIKARVTRSLIVFQLLICGITIWDNRLKQKETDQVTAKLDYLVSDVRKNQSGGAGALQELSPTAAPPAEATAEAPAPTEAALPHATEAPTTGASEPTNDSPPGGSNEEGLSGAAYYGWLQADGTWLEQFFINVSAAAPDVRPQVGDIIEAREVSSLYEDYARQENGE